MELLEQLCYIPCNFCGIMLAKSAGFLLLLCCTKLTLLIFLNFTHLKTMWCCCRSQKWGFVIRFIEISSFRSPSLHPFLILQVSVPCNRLFDVVTVRCGHCCNLWTVNMPAFQSLHPPPAALQAPSYTSNEYRVDIGSTSRWMQAPSLINKPERIVNRTPEKRQRVPSAYNQFMRDEIQRIKANNPEISHREAFSTAAKNWAHFPHIHFGLMLESNNQAKPNEGCEKQQMRRPGCN